MLLSAEIIDKDEAENFRATRYVFHGHGAVGPPTDGVDAPFRWLIAGLLSIAQDHTYSVRRAS